MARLISKLLFSFVSSAISLWVASYFVKGFVIAGLVSHDYASFLTAAAVFMAINLFVRPILKLLLSPIILLTLGLGIIVVNALALYILEYFVKSVSITDVPTLIYATLVITAVNVVLHFFSKAI